MNRWIVPLEKRYDFLRLANGKTIRVPFDQLILFSTNLEPKQLVDEAFLRRIPYKIHAADPDEATNLVVDPRYADVLVDLRGRCRRLVREAKGDPDARSLTVPLAPDVRKGRGGN